MHIIKIMFKDEMLSLLDKFYTLKASMRTLEWNTEQEIQTSQKAMVKRFIKIEEIIKTDEQRQKIQGQYVDSSICARLWDDFPRDLTAYLVFSSKISCTT